VRVDIRDAHPSDAPALTQLAHRAKASWGYPPEWLARWTADLTMTPEYLTAHRAFVAVHEGRPAGVCVLDATAEEATIEHLWVAPEVQGRGIGRALVEQALAQARALGVRHVDVESDPFAEPFYLALGARRIGSVPAPMPGDPGRVLPLLEFRV
jgi:GNAT superfamily N-acetyltransferase